MRPSIFIFLFFIFQSAYSQTLSKKYVDDWITKCDKKIEIRDITLYVIDGKPFYSPDDKTKIDSVLKEWPNDRLLDIDFFKIDSLGYEHPHAIFAIVESKGSQSARQKRKLLKKAISKYDQSQLHFDHIPHDSKDPVLLINGREVFYADCYNKLLKLQRRDIYAISVCMHHVPEEYYGKNAKNGLIQIWTYFDKNGL